MGEKISVGFEIDPALEKPQVIIKASEKNELVERILAAIESCSQEEGGKMALYDVDKILLVDPKDIIRVYTEKRKLTVRTVEGTYESRLTLKEFESKLDDSLFSRISRFELINLNRIRGFDMSISGTIKVSFEDGTETWVARRFVSEIGRKIKGKAENKGGNANA